MDRLIDARFDRVERALSSLVDSIAKYNPSTTPAIELATADKELGSGLQERLFVPFASKRGSLSLGSILLTRTAALPTVQTHQNNHLRLQSLKAASASLDVQIRETLRTLWSTRKDMTSTNTTIFPDGPQYDINYDELLSFARRISKTTLPPPGLLVATNGAIDTGTGAATGDATNTPGPADDGGRTPNTTAAQTPMAGTSTPNVATNGAPTPAAPELNSQATVATTATSLPEHLSGYLNPLTGLNFVPWPTEDKVRMGALASVQNLLGQNVDPLNFDPAEEARRLQEEEAKRADQAEKEAHEREEAMRKKLEEERLRRERQLTQERAQQEGSGSALAGGAGGPGPAGASQPQVSPPTAQKQFQFMSGFDDDDED